MRRSPPSAAALLTAAMLAAVPGLAAKLEVRAGAAAVGLYGLDVTLGSTCASPDEVTLSAPPATVSGDFEACRTLTAVGVTVTGAGASFVAGSAVVLGDGFAVADGSSFSATIDSTMPSQFAAISSPAPIAEQTFRTRFQLRLDSLGLAEGEEVEHLQALAGDGSSIFRVIVRRQGGQNLLILGATLDGGGEILTPAGQEVALAAGWNLVELDWAAGDGDGRLLVSVNQSAFVGLVDLGNGLAAIERFHWGAVDGVFAGSPGSLEVDGFTSWR